MTDKVRLKRFIQHLGAQINAHKLVGLSELDRVIDGFKQPFHGICFKLSKVKRAGRGSLCSHRMNAYPDEPS